LPGNDGLFPSRESWTVLSGVGERGIQRKRRARLLRWKKWNENKKWENESGGRVRYNSCVFCNLLLMAAPLGPLAMERDEPGSAAAIHSD
jgi:hypothetical protein